MEIESTLKYAEEHREEFVEELIELLKIPSVSAKPDHQEHILDMADQVREMLKALGMKTQRFDEGMHPLLYGEWMNAPGRPTVLFYGHYDVQPPEPLELWDSGPFEPRIEDGKIYARGASDDKGQFMTHLKAIEAFQETHGALPVNVKVLIEGEEEIGSPTLMPFVAEHTDLLRCDCAVISDGSMWADGVPALCYGLRGLATMDVEVRGPNRDIHSGVYGGIVPNPLNVLCDLIARLKDAEGRVAIPGFYDAVRPVEDWEKKQFAELNLDEQGLCKDLGLKTLDGEAGYAALERQWARPTLDLNGIEGGYQGPGPKTIIPSFARAKISMRLVPNQDPKAITEALEKYLESICPESVELQMELHAGSPAVSLSPFGPVMDTAKEAFREGFGREVVFIREGASVPVVGAFSRQLDVPCVMYGFGLQDDRLHSPNEKFNLEHFHGGIRTIIHFLQLLGGLGEKEL